MIFFLCY